MARWAHGPPTPAPARHRRPAHSARKGRAHRLYSREHRAPTPRISLLPRRLFSPGSLLESEGSRRLSGWVRALFVAFMKNTKISIP